MDGGRITRRALEAVPGQVGLVRHGLALVVARAAWHDVLGWHSRAQSHAAWQPNTHRHAQTNDPPIARACTHAWLASRHRWARACCLLACAACSPVTATSKVTVCGGGGATRGQTHGCGASRPRGTPHACLRGRGIARVGRGALSAHRAAVCHGACTCAAARAESGGGFVGLAHQELDRWPTPLATPPLFRVCD